MSPRNYSSEGFILSKKNYSESDRIITIFSKNYGKVTLIAKGVRKTKSRKRGHLEIFGKVKFSGTHGKGMDILTEVETINNYDEVRRNLKKVSLAYFFCEVVLKITREEESNEGLYKILNIVFVKLQKTKKLKQLKTDFIYNLLVKLGYWPKGKKIPDPDGVLESVLERNLSSVRVGKKIMV